MRTFIYLLLAALLPLCSKAQDSARIAAIVAEGKALYRSEMASWHGTDIFLERHKDLVPNSGGYFSYGENDLTHCVFVTKDTEPKTMAVITFNKEFDLTAATVNTEQRKLTAFESDMLKMRRKALAIVNDDTLFKSFDNTNLNLIPVINGNEKKVYVLTGPKVTGVVILGNDYLLTFDKDNNLIEKKELHKNIIPIYYDKQQPGTIGAAHTHLPETGEYITATDICTLMLYSKYAKWKKHFVVGETFVSIWDCESHELTTMSMENWKNFLKEK